MFFVKNNYAFSLNLIIRKKEKSKLLSIISQTTEYYKSFVSGSEKIVGFCKFKKRLQKISDGRSYDNRFR